MIDAIQPPSAALPVCVAALYNFTRFDDCKAVQRELAALCEAQDIKGTLLLAPEGINGTIAGSDAGIAAVLAYIRTLPGCGGVDADVKLSRAPKMPFFRLKVRIKREIVTMGQPDIDPLDKVGHYVDPADWNALISDPDTLVIDTRNDYEVAVGTFAGAVDPQTSSFREFPEWFRNRQTDLLGPDRADRSRPRPKKVAMFCTGGIRCEKSTAFLKAEGIEEVYHLKGGILKYLETVPAEESLWQGECFVFDQRVTVRQGPEGGLEPGSYVQCHACQMPLNADEVAAPEYEAGVSCPNCHGQKSEAQRARYRERQKQQALAGERGKTHIGATLERDRGTDHG